MTGAMSTFASVVGGPLMAPAAGILDALAHSLGGLGESLAAWQKSNPTAALATSAAAIAALAGGGGAAVLGAGGSVAKAIGLDSVGGALSGGSSLLGKLAMVGAEFSAVLGIIEMATNYKPSTDELKALNKWSLPGLLSGVNPFGAAAPYEIKRPTPPHTPTPSVGVPSISADPASLDAAFGKISALKDATSQPAEMAVHVETGSIDAALSKALQLRSVLKDVNADALGAASRIPTTSLGSTIRGNFSHGGINGE
jgi:hypothetical protein